MRMIHTARLALLAAAVTAAPLAGQRAERFAITGSPAVVHNLAGEVTVAAGSGSAVVVEVTRGGADAARLRVAQDGNAVRVVFPGDRVVYERMGARARSTMDVRQNGSLGGGFRSRRVTVSGTGNGVRAWADVRVLVPAGRTVQVHQGVGRVQVANVNGNLQVHTRSANVRTQGTRGGLEVDVGSGTVEVRDAQGEVAVSTGSGAVTVAGLRGDEVLVETGSGAVSATDIRARDLTIDVGSGRVQASGISARDLTVETGSGAVELALVADAQNVTIDTGSGGVTLTVPPSFGAEVLVSTGSGGITVDVPVTQRTAERNRFRGRIGDGNGRVEIDTGSGGVRIRRP
jgi:lia operon protein LiaG